MTKIFKSSCACSEALNSNSTSIDLEEILVWYIELNLSSDVNNTLVHTGPAGTHFKKLTPLKISILFGSGPSSTNSSSKAKIKFTKIKLRSMTHNADKLGVNSTSNNDLRITPIGKSSFRFSEDATYPLPFSTVNSTDNFAPLSRVQIS